MRAQVTNNASHASAWDPNCLIKMKLHNTALIEICFKFPIILLKIIKLVYLIRINRHHGSYNFVFDPTSLGLKSKYKDFPSKVPSTLLQSCRIKPLLLTLMIYVAYVR